MVLASRAEFLYLSFGILWLMVVFRKGRRALLIPLGMVLLLIGSDFICARVLKPLWARPRPYAILSSVRFYKGGRFQRLSAPQPAKHYAFPSCHALNTAAQAVFLSLLEPAVAPMALILVLWVGLSRVYLGHHFPEDVLAGWFLGAILGVLGGWFWIQRVQKRGS